MLGEGGSGADTTAWQSNRQPTLLHPSSIQPEHPYTPGPSDPRRQSCRLNHQRSTASIRPACATSTTLTGRRCGGGGIELHAAGNRDLADLVSRSPHARQFSIVRPLTRFMCETLSVTRIASMATAWAATATSKSSRRRPRCSRSALIAPKARLTSSDQAAPGPARRARRRSDGATASCGTMSAVERGRIRFRRRRVAQIQPARECEVSFPRTFEFPRIRNDNVLVLDQVLHSRGDAFRDRRDTATMISSMARWPSGSAAASYGASRNRALQVVSFSIIRSSARRTYWLRLTFSRLARRPRGRAAPAAGARSSACRNRIGL